MQHTPIILCTSEYTPDHGGVARYLSGMVAESAVPVHVVRVGRSARWYEVLGVLWRAVAASSTTPTVWCSHIFPVGTACYLISLVRRTPYMLFFHGMDIGIVSQGSALRQWFARRIVRRASRVYANSTYTAALVRRVTGRDDVQIQFPRIHPLPEHLQLSVRGQRGIPADAHVVLTVARLVYRKGVDRVLRAFAQGPESTELVVIGDGPEQADLEALATTLGIASRVHWLGAADDATTCAWYAAADTFVLVPRALPTDFEGFGMVYLEAGWYGLPVIATRCGGIPDAVIDLETGLLIADTDDTEPLVRAMEQLRTDAALRARIGTRSSARVRQYFVWNDPNNLS